MQWRDLKKLVQKNNNNKQTIIKQAKGVCLRCIACSMTNQNAAQQKGYYLDSSSVLSSGVITTCSGTSCGLV